LGRRQVPVDGEEYFGKPLEPFQPLPEFGLKTLLGWNEQGDGKLFLASIDNGRIKDEGSFKLRTALREIVQQFGIPIRLTPHHNVIFYDIEPEQQAIQEILNRCGVQTDPGAINPLVRYSMACPAMPTCGLAITESERVMPSVKRIEVLLDKVGLEQEHFVVRMTGCPNGCARPYMAELGFGQRTEATKFVRGTPAQTRLAAPYMERLHLNDLETQLEPIFVYFKQSRQPGKVWQFFRVGFEPIREFAAVRVTNCC